MFIRSIKSDVMYLKTAILTCDHQKQTDSNARYLASTKPYADSSKQRATIGPDVYIKT